jgi:site-specific DNA-methyltransferase (adenine-specific)
MWGETTMVRQLRLDSFVFQGDDVVLLPPQDVLLTLDQITGPVRTTILDPWYNKGVGGTRSDYIDWLGRVLSASARISDHIFLWGFPETVCKVLDNLPSDFELVAWLTWYYKNCPSVIRGWRSAQLACLHIGKRGARLYPEHFLNEAQIHKLEQGKLRYMPGPPSVMEAPLLVGFVGRAEQAGHPAQKPVNVIEPLVLMTTESGDTVLDPMCGSGTTGVVCRKLERRAILCDAEEGYVSMTEERLGIRRQPKQAPTHQSTV